MLFGFTDLFAKSFEAMNSCERERETSGLEITNKNIHIQICWYHIKSVIILRDKKLTFVNKTKITIFILINHFRRSIFSDCRKITLSAIFLDKVILKGEIVLTILGCDPNGIKTPKPVSIDDLIPENCSAVEKPLKILLGGMLNWLHTYNKCGEGLPRSR